MKRIWAVAVLDVRRLGFGLVSAALMFGLVPSLASGLGATVSIALVLIGLLVIVGLACGGTFGSDFAEGKGSFFFARPLPAGALIAGRAIAVVALATTAFVAAMAANWISTSDRSQWQFFVLDIRHAEALVASWSLALFMSVGVAAQGRTQSVKWGPREYFLAPFRLALSLLASLVPFGLFADMMVRAYSTPTPAKILFGSFVVAAFVSSCLAIIEGRADRSRMTRFLNLGVTAYVVLAVVVISASWTYVLHPGPGAITRVVGAEGSPDGRSAYLQATVDRGDPKWFSPVFVLDVASGEARLMDADPDQGPWTSMDGGTVAWSSATPYFFRPVWRYLSADSTFRVKTPAGDPFPLPLPSKFRQSFSREVSARIGPGFETLGRVLPNNDGTVFAIEWDRHLTLTSRASGELTDLELGADSVLDAAFIPSGDLRIAVSGPRPSGPAIEIKDISPATKGTRVVATLQGGPNASVQFDAKAARAIMSVNPRAGRTTMTLVDLSNPAAQPQGSVLISEGIQPNALFLSDGRIAAMSGGRAHGPLLVFSASGALVSQFPITDVLAHLTANEMFPGVLAVTGYDNGIRLLLVDGANGSIVRSLPRTTAITTWRSRLAPPPAGSPAARLLLMEDKLYELPSLTAEPRLLAPLPR